MRRDFIPTDSPGDGENHLAASAWRSGGWGDTQALPVIYQKSDPDGVLRAGAGG